MAALRRYVEIEEGREQGYDEIVVEVGPGKGRKQRFSGVLLGEWNKSSNDGEERYRVYRSRTGKYVVHASRSKRWTSSDPDAEKWNTGWRSCVGNWSADQTWTVSPAESTLNIVDSLEELRGMLPPELYDLVADAAEPPNIEDLDI